jgi:undecaprenyl-diphosphatase
MALIQNIDWTILQWIHTALQCPFLDFLMPKISMLGDVGAVWLIAGAGLLFTKYKRYGIMIIIGIFLGFLIGNLGLKPLVGRLRPCWQDTSFPMIVQKEYDFSFPSGHALASFIAATILTIANRKFGIVAIPLAVLIAFSRMYLYLHFPSDIIGSFILSILIVCMVTSGYKYIYGNLWYKNKAV